MQEEAHLKLRIVSLFALCVVAAAGYCLFRKMASPPTQDDVLAEFDQNRPIYEQLRTMVLSDDKLVLLAHWGVETKESPIAVIPPEGDFPEQRFHKYLSLLNAGHIDAIARSGGVNPEARFLIWGSGFAGDTRHVAICWIKKAPINQVNSLDDFYKSPKPRGPVYKSIGDNWYIWADW
jgi:hypothetical protein